MKLTIRHECLTVCWKASARSKGWSSFQLFAVRDLYQLSLTLRQIKQVNLPTPPQVWQIIEEKWRINISRETNNLIRYKILLTFTSRIRYLRQKFHPYIVSYWHAVVVGSETLMPFVTGTSDEAIVKSLLWTGYVLKTNDSHSDEFATPVCKSNWKYFVRLTWDWGIRPNLNWIRQQIQTKYQLD